MDAAVFDHAAFAYLPATCLELGFDERDDGCLGLEQFDGRRNNQLQGYERHVKRCDIYCLWQTLQVSSVDPFHHNDALILPEFPGELAVTHIYRVDANRSSLEQTVGESSCRGTHVERNQSLDLDAKPVQCCRQFEPGPAHKRRSSLDSDILFATDHSGRFDGNLAVDGYFAGHDEPSRLLTTLYQAAFQE